jgi:hypothetical protein
MQFQSGESGNPVGRPKGTKSGRMQALGVLDDLLKDEGALTTLREGLQKALERDPSWFFRRIIMPLLPKDATVQLDKTGAIQWVRLSTTIPTEGNNLSTTRAISDLGSCALDDGSERPSVSLESCSTVEPTPPATMDG